MTDPKKQKKQPQQPVPFPPPRVKRGGLGGEPANPNPPKIGPRVAPPPPTR
jgi:hypothetical protein